MNRSNLRTVYTNVKTKAAQLRNQLGAGALVAMSSVPAFAQETAGTEAVGIIDTQKAIALAVVVAGTIAVLAIKYSKLARRA